MSIGGGRPASARNVCARISLYGELNHSPVADCSLGNSAGMELDAWIWGSRRVGAAMITVGVFYDRSQAVVAKSLLDAHGIFAVLPDWYHTTNAWHLTFALQGIRLCVMDCDEEAAVELLRLPTAHHVGETRPTLAGGLFAVLARLSHRGCDRHGGQMADRQGESRRSMWFIGQVVRHRLSAIWPRLSGRPWRGHRRCRAAQPYGPIRFSRPFLPNDPATDDDGAHPCEKGGLGFFAVGIPYPVRWPTGND